MTPGSSFLKVLLVLWGSLHFHVSLRIRVSVWRGCWDLTGMMSGLLNHLGALASEQHQCPRPWCLGVEPDPSPSWGHHSGSPVSPDSGCPRDSRPSSLSSASPRQIGPLKMLPSSRFCGSFILVCEGLRVHHSLQGPLQLRPHVPISVAAPGPTAWALPTHGLRRRQTFWPCFQNVSRVRPPVAM